MREIWRRDESTVRDVFEALNAGPKKRAYTTIMTVMSRLCDKGLLERRRQGKTNFFRPVMDAEEYMDRRAGAEVAGLVDEFGDLALAHFAKRVEGLDDERLEALRRLAEEG